MNPLAADTGNRAREEDGEDGGEEPDTKRARGDGEDGAVGVGEEGMVTDESQGEGGSSGAAPAPALMELADAAEWLDSGFGQLETWFEEECSNICEPCRRTDRCEEPSQPMPDDGHCICDPPDLDASGHFSSESWSGILNDGQVSDLNDAVEAMDGQQYWNGKRKKVFEFTPDIQQRLEEYLDVRTWVWWNTEQGQYGYSDLPENVKQELDGMVDTVGRQQMAAIRAWTEESLDLYKVVTSVSDRATSMQCLQKILPYIRLLYDGLCRLPPTHVSWQKELHRGEKFIRPALRDPLPKGKTIEFNTFTSFTTDPAKAAAFKNNAFLREFVLFAEEGSDVITEGPNFTLTERLERFFAHHACEVHKEDFMNEASDIAALYEETKKDVPKLERILRTRFDKELENPEKPSRTCIMVEDGVGYRLGHLSVVPQEEEVLMEPGARLEVVEDNRFTAALCKEKETKRLILKTVTAEKRGLSLMTIKDGTKFESPAKVAEQEAYNRRQYVQEVAAYLKSISGSALTEELSRRRRVFDGGSAAARDRGAAAQATRSARPQGLRLPDVRGMMLSEECKRQTLKQQLRDEVHDFDGACDWLLQVTVRQHDGKDDEEGERVDSSKVQTAKDFRLYTVDAGQLLKVTVRNLSLDREITFTPVYVNEEGEEEPEVSVTLKAGGGTDELPYPLEKKEGEKEDSWVLKDESGKMLLRLRFALGPKP